MYIDDWPTQASRSLWYTMQEEYPQTLRSVLGNDCPTLAVAMERLRTWIEEKRIRVPQFPDPEFILEREMISCALDEVDWEVLTHRIALALDIPIGKVPDSLLLICPRCQKLLCQLCLLCVNPSCGNAHQVDCSSEYSYFQLGPVLFDFAERKLVLKVGDNEIPISHKEFKRFFTWLEIRKNG